jgi:hypothetical protein
MSVESLRNSDILRMERALQDHNNEDTKRFAALESKTDRMTGSLDVIATNQAHLMSALGVNRDDTSAKKPVALMGQKKLFWTIIGAMGGLIALDKMVFAIGPLLLDALKAIARIQ